jgi:hypothetical protein
MPTPPHSGNNWDVAWGGSEKGRKGDIQDKKDGNISMYAGKL